MVAKSRIYPDSGTIICATRYGNVMASRGSVIPLFVQIKNREPLTITDPKMTRFLMSLVTFSYRNLLLPLWETLHRL